MSERTQVRDVSRHRGVARIRRSARLPNFIVIGAMNTSSGTRSSGSGPTTSTACCRAPNANRWRAQSWRTTGT